MRAHALRILPIVLAALLGALVAATAGTAADSKQRVGDRVSLLGGRHQTFPAGAPFHVAHGWGLVPDRTDADALGKAGFSLELDGSQRRADFVDKHHETSPALGLLLWRAWVHNFPDGLTGTHTFTGRWFGACERLVEGGYYTGTCTKPTATEVTSFSPVTATVAFFPTNPGPNLALGRAVSASGTLPGSPPQLAVDGSFWSYWNSGGFAPQWLEVDLGEARSVREVALSVTQLPDSHTVHRLYGGADSAGDYVLLHEFAGFTSDLETLRFTTATPVELRFIRVETVSSASWVGWREVSVYP